MIAALSVPVELVLVLAVVALLVLSGALAIAETGLVRTSKVKAKVLAEDQTRATSALLELTSHPERFLNPILLLVLICQLVSATLLGILADQWLGAWGVLAATVFEVVIIFVFFEAVPKNWAVHNPERAALMSAAPVKSLLSFPPIRALTSALIGLANLVLGSANQAASLSTSESELLAMADIATDEAIIDPSEREFIYSIIAFGDTITSSIMTPRPKMTALRSSVSVEEALAEMLRLGYSRVPVYDEKLDDITGIVYAKDLMALSQSSRHEEIIRPHTRSPVFVPESLLVTKLLKQMQSSAVHQVIVVDEYGLTAGVVTLEDILEELVGDISDEYDAAPTRTSPRRARYRAFRHADKQQ